MTTRDLSLLTEQDRDDIAGIKEHIDGSYSQECADRLASALMSARAENKRLLDGTKEVLADVEFSIKHSDDLGRKNTLNIAQEKLRALLQSKKGGSDE